MAGLEKLKMTEIIEFGYRKGNRVEVYEFCEDPDGSPLPWYRPTGIFRELAGKEQIASTTLSYEGRCVDTGEYVSHLGELAERLILESPKGTILVALDGRASVGTRTFSESLTGVFYK